MKNFTRRPFLLFEVLIAMSLVMVLLSALMGFYIEINRLNAATEKEQEIVFKKLLLSTRLASILPQAIGSPKANLTKKDVSSQGGDFFFYSSPANDSFTKGGTQTLTLTFDNGINLNPSFSYHVLGRLYVDTENRFCLALWPSPTWWDEMAVPPMKHEILFENVEDLRFEFYLPPIKDRKAILPNSTRGASKEDSLLILGPTGEWKDSWLQEYNELPSLIRVILTVKGVPTPLTFVFPLPQSRFIIVYE